MSIIRRGLGFLRRNGSGDADPVVGRGLSALDPSDRTPGYWARFHRTVMERAGPELARRRSLARVTVSDIVSGWSRALVPTAMVAAAAAAFLLVRPEPQGPPLRLEDLMWEGVELSATATVDEAVNLSFAAEIF